VKDLVKAYEGGPNTQVIFHGSVDTFDLNVSERNKNFAKVTSTLKALEQIEMHQQEGQQLTVLSVDDLMNLLSPKRSRR
jgi:predicted transcriptional regulator